MRTRMDIVYEVCAFFVVVLGLMASAFFSTNHRDAALWSTCFAIVAAVIGVFAYWQDCLWESDATATTAQTSTDGENKDWLSGSLPTLNKTLTRGEAPQIEFHFKSTSPNRLHIKGLSTLVRIVNKGDRNFDKEIYGIKRVGLVNSHESYILPTGVVGGVITSGASALTDDQYDAVTGGQKEIVVCVAAGFIDSAGQTRVSTYCAFYDIKTHRFFSVVKYCASSTKVDLETFKLLPERPKLAFVSARMIELTAQSGARVEVVIENDGAGKAVINAQDYLIDVIENGRNIDSDLKQRVESLKVTPCDIEIGALGILTKTPPAQAIHANAVAVVEARTGLLCMVGRIEYLDREQGQHWLNYCLLYDGRSFKPYSKFNDGDSNELGQKDSTSHDPPPKA